MDEGYYWIVVVDDGTPEVGYYDGLCSGAARWWRPGFDAPDRAENVTVLSARLRAPNEPPEEAQS